MASVEAVAALLSKRDGRYVSIIAPFEHHVDYKFAPGCIFIKHRLHDLNTPHVQIYTMGVYLHRVANCAYKSGLTLKIISF